MAGNSHLGALYESVHTSVTSAMYQDWVRTDRAPDWLATVPPSGHYQLHRDILVALRAHDWDALQYAVRSHHLAMVEHMHLAGLAAATSSSPGDPPVLPAPVPVPVVRLAGRYRSGPDRPAPRAATSASDRKSSSPKP
jgi:hypothetical protein